MFHGGVTRGKGTRGSGTRGSGTWCMHFRTQTPPPRARTFDAQQLCAREAQPTRSDEVASNQASHQAGARHSHRRQRLPATLAPLCARGGAYAQTLVRSDPVRASAQTASMSGRRRVRRRRDVSATEAGSHGATGVTACDARRCANGLCPFAETTGSGGVAQSSKCAGGPGAAPRGASERGRCVRRP
eukprot:2053027-Prymnesium_polylepis.1